MYALLPVHPVEMGLEAASEAKLSGSYWEWALTLTDTAGGG